MCCVCVFGAQVCCVCVMRICVACVCCACVLHVCVAHACCMVCGLRVLCGVLRVHVAFVVGCVRCVGVIILSKNSKFLLIRAEEKT